MLGTRLGPYLIEAELGSGGMGSVYLARVADEAAALTQLLDPYQALFDRPVPAALLHMDVWGENILVDDSGEVTGLIDWDRAPDDPMFRLTFPQEGMLEPDDYASRVQRITGSTGPKISSLAMVMSGVTLSNSVGPTKKPSGLSGFL